MDDQLNSINRELIKKPFPKWPLVLLMGMIFGAAAVFAWQKYHSGNQPITSSSMPAELKFYQDNEIGISFQYPTDWQMSIINGKQYTVLLNKTDGAQPEVELPGGQYQSAGYNIKISFLIDEEIEFPVAAENKLINGFESFRYQSAAAPASGLSTVVAIKKDPVNTYLFEYQAMANQAEHEKYLPIFDQILNSLTISGSAVRKTITTPKLSQVFSPALVLSYPDDWQINQESNGDNLMKLNLDKNGYRIVIYQAPFGGSVCLFNDAPDYEGSSSDFRTVNYKSTKINNTDYRYYLLPSTNNRYVFCEKSQNYYQWPSLGSIDFYIPEDNNQVIFAEGLAIIKSVKPADSD